MSNGSDSVGSSATIKPTIYLIKVAAEDNQGEQAVGPLVLLSLMVHLIFYLSKFKILLCYHLSQSGHFHIRLKYLHNQLLV